MYLFVHIFAWATCCQRQMSKWMPTLNFKQSPIRMCVSVFCVSGGGVKTLCKLWPLGQCAFHSKFEFVLWNHTTSVLHFFCLISCVSHRHTSNHFLCYRNGLTYSNLSCDYLPGHFLRFYYFSATSQPLLVIHSVYSSSIQQITEQQSCECKALYTTRAFNLKVGFQQCQYPLGCARKEYHASHL